MKKDKNSSKRFRSKSTAGHRTVDWSNVAQRTKCCPLSVAQVQRDRPYRIGRAFDLYSLVYRYVCRLTSRQSSGLGCLLKLGEDRSGQMDIVASVKGLHFVYRLYRMRAVVVTIRHRRSGSISP